jgi:hypothetical protein
MQEQQAKPVLVALDDELDLANKPPLHNEIDVDAIRDLRAHGGEFELRFEAWGHHITITDTHVSVE